MSDDVRDSSLTRILRTFDALTFRQRHVLLLAYAEGLTQPEIADHLGLDVAAVRSDAASALQLIGTAIIERATGAARTG